MSLALTTTQPERHKAMALLETLCEQESMSCVVILGEPPSKARARFTHKGRPYTPIKTVEGEKRMANSFIGIGPFAGNVAVACVFFRSSKQRVDVDNLLKAVLDAGTRAGLWRDDSQVTAVVGVVEHDRYNPRAVIAFGHHKSSLTRGEDAMLACQACGKNFLPLGNRRREVGKYCSRECQIIFHPKPCLMCGELFKPHKYQKYCSGACRGAAHTLQVRQNPRAHCKRGHAMTEENTYVIKDGRRRCRKCGAKNAQRHRDERVVSEINERKAANGNTGTVFTSKAYDRGEAGARQRVSSET